VAPPPQIHFKTGALSIEKRYVDIKTIDGKKIVRHLAKLKMINSNRLGF
jgi:hypothetical protein